MLFVPVAASASLSKPWYDYTLRIATILIKVSHLSRENGMEKREEWREEGGTK